MSPRAFLSIPFAGLLLCLACSPAGAQAEPPQEWVGTVTTEDDVTTVVNQAGSVWGGTATLVEEASIGVEAGDDPYMFGNVRSIAAADDRIYVLDDQVPALRVYDWDGTWLHDIGGEGQGPGEFQAPSGVDVDAEGRVWVHEQVMTRMSIFTPDGALLTTHNLGGARISGSSSSMTLTTDGHAYVFDVVRPEDPSASDERTVVMRPFDVEGNSGEPIEIPSVGQPAFVEARSSNAVRFAEVPFHPNDATEFTADRVVLSGYPDAYRFEMRHADGSRTLVERTWEPVPVLAEEADAHRRAVTEYMRDMDPDWTWDAQDIPATKPAYDDFVATRSGEIWVVRSGLGSPIPDCDPDAFEPDDDPPCWTEERIVDVFGPDGRYLGELEVPDQLTLSRPPPFIRGNDVIARVEDEAGIVRVKRYRLVLPQGS